MISRHDQAHDLFCAAHHTDQLDAWAAAEADRRSEPATLRPGWRKQGQRAWTITPTLGSTRVSVWCAAERGGRKSGQLVGWYMIVTVSTGERESVSTVADLTRLQAADMLRPMAF